MFPSIAQPVQRFVLQSTTFAIILVGITITNQVQAAERVTLTYGAIERSIPVEQLETLAASGTLPAEAHELTALLELLEIEPKDVQANLTATAEFNLLEIDAVAYSDIGEDLLLLAGQIVHTPPQVAPIAALRGMLLTAIADDGQTSLLELIQCYPTPEMMIDVKRLLSKNWREEGDLSGLTNQFHWEVLQ
jgi:hypothetical protein